MRSLYGFASIVWFGFVAACSSSSDGSGASSDAGAHDDATAGDTGTEAASQDGGSDDAGSLATPFILQSSMVEHAFVDASTQAVTNLVFVNAFVEPNGRCTMKKTGACYLSDCRTAPPDSGPIVPRGLDVGTLSVTNGTDTLSAPGDSHHTYSAFQNRLLWTAGNTLTFASTGGAAPPIAATLTVPAELTLTTPDPGNDSSFSKSAPFALAWSNGAGKVIASLSTGETLLESVRLVCEFDASSGSGSIPPEMFAAFLVGPRSVTMNIGNAATADVMAGAIPIHVYALFGHQVILDVTP